MKIQYNRLWKQLIDKKLKKKELKAMASLSNGTMSKLGKDEPVNLSVILRIAEALGCDINDILEIV